MGLFSRDKLEFQTASSSDSSLRRSPLLLQAWILGILFFGLFQTNPLFAQKLPPRPLSETITNLAQLASFSSNEAPRNVLVSIRATVTYCDREWNQLFLQDSSGAMSLVPKGLQHDLHPPELIELRGTVSANNHSLDLAEVQYKSIQSGAFPEPEMVTIKEMLNNDLQCYWISLYAVIRESTLQSGRVKLEVVSGNSRLIAYVRQSIGKEFFDLPGSRVLIQAVYGQKYDDDDIEGCLYIPSFDNIKQVGASLNNRLSLPKAHIKSVLDSTHFGQEADCLHIAGEVIQAISDMVSIRDTTGWIKVQMREPQVLHPGDQIHLWGFPARSKNEVILENAHSSLEQPFQSAYPARSNKNEALPLLERIQSVRELSKSDAEDHFPVNLRGVVTYADADWDGFFIQDKSDAIYVVGHDDQLRTGKFVEVRGFTDPGGVTPRIINSVIRILGETNLPPPARVPFTDLLKGTSDCNWIELDGVVYSFEDVPGHVTLHLLRQDGTFTVAVPCVGMGDALRQLLNAKVRCYGAAATILNPDNSVQFDLKVPSTNYISMIDPPLKNFFDTNQVAPSTIQKLFASTNHDSLNRVILTGTITFEMSENEFFLQDSTGAIRIRLVDASHLSVGDTVEISGYDVQDNTRVRWLMGCHARLITKTDPVIPKHTLATVLAHESSTNTISEGMLVQLDAKLLDNAIAASPPHLLLESDNVVFRAIFSSSQFPKTASLVPPGSQIRLHGVYSFVYWQDITRSYSATHSSAHPEKHLVLYLQDWDDVDQIGRPFWWLMLMFGFLFFTLAAGSLGWLLKRQVQRRIAQEREQLRREAALEERYRDLFENAIDMLLTATSDGAITSANQLTETFFNKTKRDLIGSSLFDLVQEESRNSLSSWWTQVVCNITQESIFVQSISNLNTPALLDIHARIIPRSDKTIEIQVNMRDITEKHRLQMDLMQAQKMEMVGQLAAGVAHDFNNILTVIQGYLNIMLDPDTSPSEYRQCLEEMKVASDRATRLTQQLLTYSRKKPLKRKPLELNRLVLQTGSMLRRLIGEQLELEMPPESPLPLISADHGMMEQVLINLVVNARDAMPQGGKLTILTQVVDIAPDQPKRSKDSQPGSFVCLTMRDNGKGMSELTLAHLFEPFYTTKGVGKGTGLGLATVHGIVKQHQGWIEVDSSPGNGSSFFLFFPISENQVDSATETPQSPVLAKGTETILVAEDEPAVREMLERILRAQGYTVLAAASGPEALALWEIRQSEIQLLLTDMVMPGGMNGKELAEKLTHQKPSLKVIYSSGYSNELLQQSSEFTKGIHFIPKPFAPSRLVQIVRQVLDGKITESWG